MPAFRETALHGRWVHSHEEDTEDEMVFRPADRPLPRARGRMALELRADGTYAESSPGPVDVPETRTGTWSLHDDRLTLVQEGDDALDEWRVTAVEPDRLQVRRA